MWKWLVAQGPAFNAALITALTMIPTLLAFSILGWLGVGLLGVLGLLVAVKVDLNEDAVAGDMTRMNKVYREQLAERARRNPNQVAAEALARGRVLKVVRLVFGALTATGFGVYAISLL
ncbi:MAG: hypothetical protein QNI93_18295 [Kiloniellales bacterium]|nr:hypothetical protein [Kiloniellales bacterium]